MQRDDFYSVLGVSENAGVDEIKKAYRQLSLKYHPDRNNGDIEKVKIFQKINEAYETLGDADKKQEYDMGKKNPFMRMNCFGASSNKRLIRVGEVEKNFFSEKASFAPLYCRSEPFSSVNKA